MEFEQAAELGIAMLCINKDHVGDSAGMLVGCRRIRWADRDAWQKTLSQTLQLEEAGGSIVFRIESGSKTRNFAVWINRAADFEQTELLEVACVVVDVLPDARKQAGAQQVLIGRDGTDDLHVRGRIQRKHASHFLADE